MTGSCFSLCLLEKWKHAAFLAALMDARRHTRPVEKVQDGRVGVPPLSEALSDPVSSVLLSDSIPAPNTDHLPEIQRVQGGGLRPTGHSLNTCAEEEPQSVHLVTHTPLPSLVVWSRHSDPKSQM